MAKTKAKKKAAKPAVIKLIRAEAPESLYKKFKAKTSKNGVSMAEVIRTLVTNYVK